VKAWSGVPLRKSKVAQLPGEVPTQGGFCVAGRAAWSPSCSAARGSGRGAKALSLARAIWGACPRAQHTPELPVELCGTAGQSTEQSVCLQWGSTFS
jgi:hypothetical protein